MERREYPCALCGGRPSSSERRTASSFAQILYKHFSVNAIETGVLCNKCRHKCRNSSRRKQISDINLNNKDDAKDPTFRSPKRSKCIPVSSPPSIALPLPSSSRSHSYCFVCNKPGPKLLSVTNQARMDVFLRKEIIIPPGARCCAGDLVSGKLSDDAVQKILTNDGVLRNRSSVLTIIHGLREWLSNTKHAANFRILFQQ